MVCKRGQFFEIGARLLFLRWDAHEARYRKAAGVATKGEKGFGFIRKHAVFLRLFTDIDFDIKARILFKFCYGFLERFGKVWAVDGLDDVKGFYGFLGLVRLQAADEMQLDIGIVLPQDGKLFFCFLNPVLAEDALSGLKGFSNDLDPLSFADGDERGVAEVFSYR